MGLKEIRQGLADRLDTIEGLTVYTRPLESVRETPCAMVLPRSGTIPQSFTGGGIHILTVRVLVSLGQGWDEAQDELDEYIDLTGTTSVAAAIDGDATLDGAANWARMTGYGGYGGYEVAGTLYLGVEIEVEADEN